MITDEIRKLFAQMVGLPCTRKQVGEWKSLTLGFGEEDLSRRYKSQVYQEWELGTYDAFWEISNSAGAILSKGDAKSDVELDPRLELVEIGAFAKIYQVSDVAVRVETDNGVSITFTSKADPDDDEEEFFHLFAPGHRYVNFTSVGWRLGPSDTPWPY